jgi:hypothetical protein
MDIQISNDKISKNGKKSILNFKPKAMKIKLNSS